MIVSLGHRETLNSVLNKVRDKTFKGFGVSEGPFFSFVTYTSYIVAKIVVSSDFESPV